jgi:rhodanese-related sulfurtransferase
MHPILIIGGIVILGIFIMLRIWRVRSKRQQMEGHCITADQLHELLASQPSTRLYDVRLPLDLLVDAEIIPGAQRISPREVIDNPSLIPREQDSIVYCTCPGEESSRKVLERTLSRGFRRVKFLKGGLAAWKAKGYPVEPYERPFRLDTADAG